MQWWEVNRFLAGLRRRYRPQYESTRRMEWTLACMFWDKRHGMPPQTPQDYYSFTWEKKQQETTISEKEVEDALQLMNNYNAEINNGT